MALVNCTECRRDISNKAHACPGCGAPMAAHALPLSVERTGAKWEGTGFLLILAGMFSAFSGNGVAMGLGGAVMLVGFIVFIIGRFK